MAKEQDRGRRRSPSQHRDAQDAQKASKYMKWLKWSKWSKCQAAKNAEEEKEAMEKAQDEASCQNSGTHHHWIYLCILLCIGRIAFCIL